MLNFTKSEILQISEPAKPQIKQKLIAIGFSLLPMLIYFFLLLLFVILIELFRMDYDKIFPLIHTVSMAVSCAVMCAVLKKRTGKTLSFALRWREFNLHFVLGLAVFTWCAVEVVDGIVAGICSGFMTVKPNLNPEVSLGAMIEAVLTAPIFEEIIFRFLGLEFIEKYFPLPLLCTINAIYFALLHGYNIEGFFNVTLFALCMSYAYLKTRRLLYVIFVHILHNAVCLIDYGDWIFFGSPIYREKNGFTLASPQWIIFNFIIVAAFILYIWKCRNLQSKYHKRKLKREEEK